MRRIGLIVFVLLLTVGMAGAQSEDAPGQIYAALSDLSTYVGRPIRLVDLTGYRWGQNFYTSTDLGCPLRAGEPAPQGLFAYTFLLTLDGLTYDWRVSQDGSIVFPCDATLLAAGRAAPQYAATLPPELNLNVQCPAGFSGYLAPRLQVGGQAQIGEGGLPNRLRNAPSPLGTQLGVINPGRTVNVLGGPACDGGGTVWWLVEIDGTVGWTAEGTLTDSYYLDPVGDAGGFDAQVAGDVITAENAANLTLERTLEVTGADLAWSADGRYFVVTGEETRLLNYPDLTTADLYPESALQLGVGTAAAFGPTGAFLAVGTETGDIHLFGLNPAAPAAQRINVGPVGGVVSLAFSPQGVIGTGREFAAGGAGELRLLDSPLTGYFSDPSGLAIPRTAPVIAIAFSPDGTLAAGLSRENIVVVDVVSGQQFVEAPLVNPGSTVGDLVFLAAEEGYALAYSDGDELQILDLNTGEGQQVAPFPPNAVTDLALHPTEALLAVVTAPADPSTADAEYTLDLIGLEELNSVFNLTTDEPILSVGFDPIGTALAVLTASGVEFYTLAGPVG